MALTVTRATDDSAGRGPSSSATAASSEPARSHRFRSDRPTGTNVGYFPAWRGEGSYAATYGIDGRDPNHPLLRQAALRVRDEAQDPGQVFPWPTFVLGSGCLAGETPSDADLTPEVVSRVADVVAAVLEGQDFSRIKPHRRADIAAALGRPGLREITADFIVEMAAARAPGRVSDWLAQAERIEGADAERRRFGVLAALGAALGARLYLDTTSVTRSTLTAPMRESVEFDVHRYPQLHRVDVEVRRPLRDLVELLEASELSSEPGVGAFLKVVATVATDATVVRERVEVLGAFAWHFLTDATSIYPGWSDILLFQAAESDGSAEQFLQVPMLRRPSLTSLSVLDRGKSRAWLVTRLRAVTERSWSEGGDERSSERESFYDAVADALIDQARAGATVGANAPLATAFISGFDVELEMSLLRRLARAGAAPEPHEFAVVVPVFLVQPRTSDSPRQRSDYDTTLCWVWKKVDARSATPLESLLDEGEWRYFNSSKTGAPSGNGSLARDLRGVPVVVHLSGAPLIRVAQDKVVNLPEEDKGHTLRPALLLDENTALIQVALDLREWNGRLPPDLAADTVAIAGERRFGPRYWTFVGVQLSDPSVRLRLLSHEISTAWGNAHERHQDVHPTADRGVVVNTWSPVSDRQLFHWQGFGVVKAEAKDLTADIEHLNTFVSDEFRGWMR